MNKLRQHLRRDRHTVAARQQFLERPERCRVMCVLDDFLDALDNVRRR